MKYRPMSDSLVLTAMIVLIVAGFLTFFGRIPLSWGFTFILLSLLFILASFVSITPTDE